MLQKVSMRDLFSAVKAVFCFVLGGIELAGLSADSGVLRKITGAEVTSTGWTTAHLEPPNRFGFSWRCITYVLFAIRPGLLSLFRLYHLFSKLKLTKYYEIIR